MRLHLFLFAALLEKERFGVEVCDGIFVVSPQKLASVWDSDESLKRRSSRLTFVSAMRSNDRSQMTVVPVFDKERDELLLSFVVE